jgi:OOP family OmpA-OmpF porin
MSKHAVLAIACASALISSPARADDTSYPWKDEVGQWFVMPYLGQTFVDDDRLLDDDLHYGVALGKHLNEEWSAQLNLYDGDFDADRSPAETPSWPASFEGSISGLSFDLMRVFARESRFSPYLLGGLGMQRSDYEGLQGDDNVAASLGLGAMWDIYRNGDGSRTLQLRPEVRTRWDMQSGNTLNDTLAQVGLSFGWGAPRPLPAPAAEPAPPPPPPPPPAPVKCADGDNDGVCDADDKCPGTAAGVKVDSVGCPLEQRLKLKFDFDSAELRPESITELERLVKFMGQVPFATALIEGHTDSVGADAYNQSLSDRRAKAVFDYLTSRGVDPARLKSLGKGESEPVADNQTAEGRQENRRVLMIRTDSGR